MADHVQHVLGVGLVHDREVGAEPGRLGVDAQQAVGDGVERAAPDAAGRRRRRAATMRRGALEHLLGRAAGEGQQQDALGVDARGDQVGDAVGERARLAAAGAGDDQQRAVAVRDGLALLGVQLVQPRIVFVSGCHGGWKTGRHASPLVARASTALAKNTPGLRRNVRGAYFSAFFLKSSETELMQYRMPVGFGPSSKT